MLYPLLDFLFLIRNQQLFPCRKCVVSTFTFSVHSLIMMFLNIWMWYSINFELVSLNSLVFKFIFFYKLGKVYIHYFSPKIVTHFFFPLLWHSNYIHIGSVVLSHRGPRLCSLSKSFIFLLYRSIFKFTDSFFCHF